MARIFATMTLSSAPDLKLAAFFSFCKFGFYHPMFVTLLGHAQMMYQSFLDEV
jgi:hypothetical protein